MASSCDMQPSNLKHGRPQVVTTSDCKASCGLDLRLLTFIQSLMNCWPNELCTLIGLSGLQQGRNCRRAEYGFVQVFTGGYESCEMNCTYCVLAFAAVL